MLLLDSPTPEGPVAIYSWVNYISRRMNRPVSTSTVISACWRLMQHDVKISGVRIRTHMTYGSESECAIYPLHHSAPQVSILLAVSALRLIDCMKNIYGMCSILLAIREEKVHIITKRNVHEPRLQGNASRILEDANLCPSSWPWPRGSMQADRPRPWGSCWCWA